MREKLIFLAKVCMCLAASILVGCLLIIFVYMLPMDKIRRNVETSVDMVEQEGTYYQWAPGYKNAQSDNYTDASLILNAIHLGTGNPVADAMNVPRTIFGEDNNERSVAMSFTKDISEGQEINYGRYWHGSLVFLKTALLFFDLSDIRVFSMILQITLLLLVAVGFCRRKKEIYLLGLGTAVIMLNPVTTIFCFCFSVEYILMLIMTVLILLFHEYFQKGNRYYFLFLFSGITFVYFNELSFPMIGLGIPLVVYLLLSEEKSGELIKKEVLFTALWGVGYSVMWLGKWICAWILTGQNYIKDALDQATRYTSDHATWEVENPSVIDRIFRNINMYLKWPYLFLAIIVLIIIGIVLFRATKSRKLTKQCLMRLLPYFLIMLLPFAIFIGLGNGYSYVHYWFTHKLLAIGAFAGICMLLKLKESENS